MLVRMPARSPAFSIWGPEVVWSCQAVAILAGQLGLSLALWIVLSSVVHIVRQLKADGRARRHDG